MDHNLHPSGDQREFVIGENFPTSRRWLLFAILAALKSPVQRLSIILWFCAAHSAAQQTNDPGISGAQKRSPNQNLTVSVQDLDPTIPLSRQQIFTDIGALAKARRESASLLSLNQLIVSGGKIPGMSEIDDLPEKIREGRVRVQDLESELRKAMTRAAIESAVRSWNQLSLPLGKLKTPTDFQNALKTPSKRRDAIRALAATIAQAANEKEVADFRELLMAIDATPASRTFIDLLLKAQYSDVLTAVCASLVLSRVTLSTEQAQQMRQVLSTQQTRTKSDPIIQHLIDLAQTSFPGPNLQ